MFKLVLCLFIGMNVQAAELKVLSWNAYMLPKIAKKTFQNTRAKLIANHDTMKESDIIMFQEVFTKKSFKIISEELLKTHPYHTGKPFRSFFKPINSGLVIFSKYPLSDIRFKLYKGMAHADFFSSKGVLMATATLPDNQKVRLATTHLQAQSGEKYTRIRSRQLEVIRKSLFEGYANDDLPLIFGGDFNISHHSPLHEYFWDFMDFHGAEYLKPQGKLIWSAEYATNDMLKCLSDNTDKQKWIDFVFLHPKKSNLKMIDFQIHNFTGSYDLYETGEKSEYSLSDHHAAEATISL